MTTPLPCHDLTHGPTVSQAAPKLHHHDGDGKRQAHARFGNCPNCARGWGMYGAPTTEATYSDGRTPEAEADAYARATAGLADLHPHIRTLSDGSTIETFADMSRVWTAPDGVWRSGPDFGPWQRDPVEPLFVAQTCPSCGAEHPGARCGAYEADLFGGAS